MQVDVLGNYSFTIVSEGLFALESRLLRKVCHSYVIDG